MFSMKKDHMTSTTVLVLLVQPLDLTMIHIQMHTTQCNPKCRWDYRRTNPASRMNDQGHPHAGPGVFLVEEAGAEEDRITLIHVGFPAEIQHLFVVLTPLE
jgi:hypothetical protein